MWNGDYPEGLTSERCKPNYTQQLERLREDLKVTVDLINAMYSYAQFHGSPSSRDCIPTLQLMGYLVFRRNSMAHHEQRLLELIEEDDD